MPITLHEIQTIQIKYAQFLKRVNAPSGDSESLQALVGEISTRVKVIFNKQPKKMDDYDLQGLPEKLRILQLDMRNTQLINEISVSLYILLLLISPTKKEPVNSVEEEDATIRVNNILIEQKTSKHPNLTDALVESGSEKKGTKRPAE